VQEVRSRVYERRHVGQRGSGGSFVSVHRGSDLEKLGAQNIEQRATGNTPSDPRGSLHRCEFGWNPVLFVRTHLALLGWKE